MTSDQDAPHVMRYFVHPIRTAVSCGRALMPLSLRVLRRRCEAKKAAQSARWIDELEVSGFYWCKFPEGADYDGYAFVTEVVYSRDTDEPLWTVGREDGSWSEVNSVKHGAPTGTLWNGPLEEPDA